MTTALDTSISVGGVLVVLAILALGIFILRRR